MNNRIIFLENDNLLNIQFKKEDLIIDCIGNFLLSSIGVFKNIKNNEIDVLKTVKKRENFTPNQKNLSFDFKKVAELFIFRDYLKQRKLLFDSLVVQGGTNSSFMQIYYLIKKIPNIKYVHFVERAENERIIKQITKTFSDKSFDGNEHNFKLTKKSNILIISEKLHV
jgi:hypothetical protein